MYATSFSTTQARKQTETPAAAGLGFTTYTTGSSQIVVSGMHLEGEGQNAN
jgi:hypothetical protein